MTECARLFRGKRTENGEWKYGVPHYNLDNEIEFITVPGKIYPNCFKVDPETLGQFTGLVVANGKVFDGDYLKFGAYTLEVFWNGESFQWQAGIVGRSYDRRFRCCGEHRNDNWTVIDLGEIAAEPIITGEMTTEIVGNRWDNPELIPPKPEPIFIF